MHGWWVGRHGTYSMSVSVFDAVSHANVPTRTLIQLRLAACQPHRMSDLLDLIGLPYEYGKTD